MMALRQITETFAVSIIALEVAAAPVLAFKHCFAETPSASFVYEAG